jgi:NAD(P)-dependent dehydrogenase (short-subunit alcohol dehydrogenase family)
MTRLLEGKVALVTGAGSGIGRAITIRAAAEGAQVLAADISGAEEQVAKEVGSAVVPYRVDVAQPDQVAAMFDTCRERFGRLDVLFNNAGISGWGKRLHEYAIDDWDRVMSVNVRGAFLVLKHGLALMLESGGGAVVNSGSLGGFRATPSSSAYVTSKGAMVMMTRAAALEYVNDNIRVNAVCPGTTDTPILGHPSPQQLDMVQSRIPMGRLGKPEEVASLALFLASDQASYITGQCMIIDGGRSAG